MKQLFIRFGVLFLLLTTVLRPITSQTAVDYLCKSDNYIYGAYTFTEPSDEVKSNTLVKISNDTLLRAFYIARCHFPELKDMSVRLQYKPMKNSTMMAQPSYNIFRGKSSRRYNIFVNEAVTSNGISYQDLSFNALVGWFGHEIAHLADYRERSLLNMAGFGIRYVFSKAFMRATEYRTDSITIAHGLGCQLLEGVEFCLSSEKISPSYKQKLKSYYMLPEQIRDILNASSGKGVTTE